MPVVPSPPALTSRIPAAMDALEAMLVGQGILDSEGNPVPIDVGWPNLGPQREHIWISGRVEDWQEEQEVTGDMATVAREETFLLGINILVAWRDTFKATRDRAFVLLGGLEEALRQSYTLNDTVFQAEKRSAQMSEGVQQEQRDVLITVKVAVDAYLSG